MHIHTCIGKISTIHICDRPREKVPKVGKFFFKVSTVSFMHCPMNLRSKFRVDSPYNG